MSTSGGPEYLDTGARPEPAQGNDNRKRLVVTGGVIGAVALIGGGAWAATSFFATGSQPAEALPASTIVYASVDLDPSGGQKIEAIQMLRKFPAFADEIDLDTDDDLRARLFEEITSSGECEGLDYAADVEPWLGSRAAVAAVDAGGESPVPVVVVQVKDADAADEGMSTVVEKCGGSDLGGWVVEGDWAVIAESDEVAQQVVDKTAEADLASDDAFTRWTGEAGGDGIMTMYAARSVVDYADSLNSMGSLGGLATDGLAVPGAEETDPELQEALDSFEGAAMSMRFDDGSLELEMAASAGATLADFGGGADVADLVGSLPEQTIAAFGLSLPDGWVEKFADQAVAEGEGASVDELFAQAGEETGLDFPEDLETLLGDGVVVALGEGIDPDAFANGGAAELPIGIKIKGDADEIQRVIDKIDTRLPPEQADLLQVEEADGYAIIGLNDEFKAELAQDGSLGDSDAYQAVVPDADDTQYLLYVDFNADDDWLVRLAGDTPDVAENLAPLAGFGVSAWVDGEVGHGLVKLTTD